MASTDDSEHESASSRVPTLSRRQLLTAAGASGVIGTAGCAGLFLDSRYVASKAAIPTWALFDHHLAAARWLRRSETINTSAGSQTVTLANHLTAYVSKQTDSAGIPKTGLGLFTTPSVTFAGQQLNPVAALSEKQLVQTVATAFPGYGKLTNIRGSGSRKSDESSLVWTVFTAEAQRSGTTRTVKILVSRQQHAGEFLVQAGVYLDSGFYGDTIDGLTSETVHPVCELNAPSSRTMDGESGIASTPEPVRLVNPLRCLTAETGEFDVELENLRDDVIETAIKLYHGGLYSERARVELPPGERITKTFIPERRVGDAYVIAEVTDTAKEEFAPAEYKNMSNSEKTGRSDFEGSGEAETPATPSAQDLLCRTVELYLCSN